MLNLKKVTLVSIVTRQHADARAKLEGFLKQADFGGVVVFTDQPAHFGGDGCFTVTPRDYHEWCVWRLTEMPKFRDKFAGHILFVETDSAIVKPDAWTPDYLKWDYIGAPWLDGMQGNGGFCLISQRLLAEIEALNIPPNVVACFPSDYKICRVYRRWLERQGIKFAPLKVAQQFSSEQGPYTNSFGVHSYRGCQNSILEACK